MVYLATRVPWIPWSLDGEIEMVEGEPSCSHWDYSICVPAAFDASQV